VLKDYLKFFRTKDEETDLVRLIYISQATFKPNEDAKKEIDSITAISSRNNRHNHVTGALVYCNGWFLQALEGKWQVVEDTLTRISDNPKHTGIRVLEVMPIHERGFAKWSMIGSVIDPIDEVAQNLIGFDDAFDPTQVDGSSALLLLQKHFSDYEKTI
jgi:hypothetical protein